MAPRKNLIPMCADGNGDPYVTLANVIMLSAAEDYRSLRRRLNAATSDVMRRALQREIRVAEAWFDSLLAGILSRGTSHDILERLKREF